MTLTRRIINFLIDSLVFFGLTILSIWVTRSKIDPIQARYFFIAFYFIYYLTFEYAFGKTVGKFITKTKVVSSENLTRPTFIQILIRTISRIIPFYFISYLMTGKGMHDHFSKTILIKSKNQLL